MTTYKDALIEAAQEFHAHEMNVGQDAFGRFCERAEVLLGLETNRFGGGGLDGDEDIDGYSINGACDAFDAGQTVKQYVETVRRHPLFGKVSAKTRDHEYEANKSDMKTRDACGPCFRHSDTVRNVLNWHLKNGAEESWEAIY